MINKKSKILFLVGIIISISGFLLHNNYPLIVWGGIIITIYSIILMTENEETDAIYDAYTRKIRKTKYTRIYFVLKNITWVIFFLYGFFFIEELKTLSILGLLLSIYIIPYNYKTYYKRRVDD